MFKMAEIFGLLSFLFLFFLFQFYAIVHSWFLYACVCLPPKLRLLFFPLFICMPCSVAKFFLLPAHEHSGI